MTGEIYAFESHLATKGLRKTRQRNLIANIFFDLDKHISAEELYKRVTKKDPSIGFSTVYRTLNLLKEAGLAKECQFGDTFGRFEPVHSEAHHDHLICTRCGQIIEFKSDRIEKLQADLAKEQGFTVFDHKLELYGLCNKCSESMS